MPPARHSPAPLPLRSSLALLGQIEPFRQLDKHELTAVASVVRLSSYQRGAFMIEMGSPLYIVCTGLALLCSVSPAGQQVALEVLQAGDLYRLDTLDELMGARLLQILENGTVLATVERFTLRRLMAIHPDPCIALLEQNERQLARVYRRIVELSTCSVQVRLAHLLAQIAHDDRVSGLSRDVLGLMVGASRKQVTTALDGLRAEGLVAYQRRGREIVLCDRARLAGLTDPPYKMPKFQLVDRLSLPDALE
jgi:CRP-like cAMP-binding protein